jgi:hypothetical protein
MADPRANNSETAVVRNTSGLKRGGPGRKPGVPNKVTQEVKAVASRLVDDPDYLASLERRLKRGKCAPAVETMLWHYAKGKPKDQLEVTGADGGPLIQAIRWVKAETSEPGE